MENNPMPQARNVLDMINAVLGHDSDESGISHALPSYRFTGRLRRDHDA